MKIQKISIALSLALILLVAVAGSLYANLPTRYFDNIQANGYAVVDGQEDANQLRVQGYTTQTNNLAVFEQSDGDDKVIVTNAGGVTVTTDAGTDLVNIAVGSLKVGNGTPGTALNGEDAYIEGGLEVDGTSSISAVTAAGNVTFGNSDTTGVDVTAYSDTSGDYLMWDASEQRLTIIGADGADALIVSDGNVNIADNATVGGNVTITGTSDLQGNVADSAGDFTIADNAAVTGTLDVQGATLQFGPNNLYPLGEASSGFQVSHSYDTITGTLAVTHGLTSPIVPFCQLGQAPSAVAGEAYDCWVEIAGAVMTVTVVSSDTTEATSSALVYWAVFGTP